MTLLHVRNKYRERAMTVTKIQGMTITVDSMEVIAVMLVVIMLDQVARMEMLNPPKAPGTNRHRINVKELTADRTNVNQQGMGWSSGIALDNRSRYVICLLEDFASHHVQVVDSLKNVSIVGWLSRHMLTTPDSEHLLSTFSPYVNYPDILVK